MGKALEIFAARIKELRDEQGLGLREAAANLSYIDIVRRVRKGKENY
jgi:hypothetical protein